MNEQQRAVVQQALDALELNNNEWKSLADSGDCGYWKAEDQDHYKQTSEAITALRQLLEQPVQEPVLQEIEQYRMQMAGISTAALGYWKEDDGIHPDYDTPALRDVAKLYAKYAATYTTPPAQPAPAHGPYSAPIKHLWPVAPKPWVGLDAANWFEWWRTAAVLEHTQAEIDFADFLLIATAVQDVLEKKNGGVA